MTTTTADVLAEALGTLTDDDVVYDHPVSMVGPMDPVLFVRYDAIAKALTPELERLRAVEAAARDVIEADKKDAAVLYVVFQDLREALGLPRLPHRGRVTNVQLDQRLKANRAKPSPSEGEGS
jgi:hypothetical protein